MAAIFYTDDSGNEVRFDFPPGINEISIGRGAGNVLRIRKPSISRRHACITLSGGQFALMDLGSSNGSFVNGERLQAKVPHTLTGNESIKCGEIPLRFEGSAPAAAVAPAPPVMAPPAPVPPAPAPPAGLPDPFADAGEPAAPAGGDLLGGIFDDAAGGPPAAPDLGFDAAASAPASPFDDIAEPGLGGIFGEAGPADAPAPPSPFDDPAPVAAADIFADAPAPEPIGGIFDDSGPTAAPPAAPLDDVFGDDAPAPDLDVFGTDDSDVFGDDAPMAPLPLPGDPGDQAFPAEAAAIEEVEAADIDEPVYQEEKSVIIQAVDDAAFALFGDDDDDDDIPDLHGGPPAGAPPAPVADAVPAPAPAPAPPAEEIKVELDALPPLPDDPGLRSTELERLLNKTRDDLLAKMRRVVSLQKAARRDVDTKKKLQEDKASADQAAEDARTAHEQVTAERDTLREDVTRLNGLLQEGEAGVSQIEAQLQETRAELDTTRVQRDELTRRVESLTVQLEGRPTHEHVEDLDRQVAALQSQVQEFHTENVSLRETAERVGSLEKNLAEVEAENERLAEALDAAPTPARYKEMELELRALRRESGRGDGRASVIEKQLNDTKDAFAAFKAKAKATFMELAGTLKSLDAEKLEAEAQLLAAREAGGGGADDELVESLRGKLDRARERAEEAERQVADLEQALDDASAAEPTDGDDERVADLEQANEALSAELGELREQLEAVRSESADPGIGVGMGAEALEEAAALQTRVADLEAQLEAATQDAGDDEKLAALRDSEDRLLGRVAELEDQIERLQDDLAANAAAPAAEAGPDLSAANDALTEENARLAEDVSALREALSAASAPSEDGGASEEVQRQLDDQARELEARSGALEAAHAELDELRGKIDELQNAGGGDAAPGEGGVSADDVSDLLDKVNDTVSQWKNTFLHLGNFVMDVTNGVNTLKGGGDVQSALEEIESSGAADEIQESVDRAEQDARTLKRDLRTFKAEKLGR